VRNTFPLVKPIAKPQAAASGLLSIFSIRRGLWGASLILGLLTSSVVAQRNSQNEEAPPKPSTSLRAPVARDVTVDAVRGQTVEIKLLGLTSTNKDLAFKLRDLPKFGTVESDQPKILTKDSATIRYLAQVGMTETADVITYYVQYEGGSPSNTATISINLVDPSPKIVAPLGFTVDRMVLGDTVEKRVALKNAGNVTWAAKVPLPEGWSWVLPKDGSFNLAPGAETDIQLRYVAHRTGRVQEVITLHRESKLHVTGHVVPPFTAFPRNGAMQWRPESTSRTVTIELHNNAKTPLKLRLEGPPEIQLSPTLEIAAEQSASLVLATTAPTTEAWQGTVTLTGPSTSETISLSATPAPAHVVVASGFDVSGGIDFGKLDATNITTTKRDVVLENVGGAPATVRWEKLGHYRIEMPAAATIAPLGRLTIPVFPPTDPALVQLEVSRLEAGQLAQDVRLNCGLDGKLAATQTMSLAEQTLLANTVNAGQTSQLSFVDRVQFTSNSLLASDGTEDPKIPRINTVSRLAETAQSVTIGWDLPPGDGWTFRLLRARVRKLAPDVPPSKVLEPMTAAEAEIKIDGRRATAVVRGLVPYSLWIGALQTISPDGKKSYAGREIQLVTVAEEPTPWLGYGIGIFALGALGFYARKRWNAPIRAVG
jgi:hypothetical protein